MTSTLYRPAPSPQEASIVSALLARTVAEFDRAPPLSSPHSPEDLPLRYRGGLSPRAYARVRAFVELNMGQSISLQRLADVACISQYHFARMFRITAGTSPMRYVVRARVLRACQAMATGELNVAGLASDLGFCDQSHLTRTFRRLVGCCPREYAFPKRHGVSAERRRVIEETVLRLKTEAQA